MISFNNKLIEHANNAKSLLCVGLDINPEKALEYFGDRITPSNNMYYSYFKALALKASNRTDEANGIFEYIANFNFLGWEPGLTRNLSISELKS